MPVHGGHVGVPSDALRGRETVGVHLRPVQECGELRVPERVLEEPNAVLNHGIEGCGPHRGRVLAHLLSQVHEGDDDADGADKLTQVSQRLQRGHEVIAVRSIVAVRNVSRPEGTREDIARAS